MSRVVWIVVVMAAAVFFAVPTRAAETWVQVKSPGFTVVCDGSEKEARQVAWQLEQIRAVVKRIWPWAQLDMARPVVVFSVRDEKGLRALAPRYWEEKGTWRPAAVWASGRDATYIALRRDITARRAGDEAWDNPYLIPYRQYFHLVLERNFSHLPFWFEQGLTEYWGNTIIDGKVIYEGRAVPSHLRVLRERPLLPFDRLFAVTRDSPEFKQEGRSDVFFAQIWTLMHYLIMGSDARRGQINTFLQLVLSGKADDEAAKAAFGDLGVLVKELDAYVRQAAYRYAKEQVALDVAAGELAGRPLSPAESMGLRARFHVAMRRPTEAQALIDGALALEPELASAHEAAAYLAYDGNREQARERLARVLTSPDASFYAHFLWAYLERTADASPQALERVEAELRKAVELNHNFAPAYAELSWVKSRRGAPLEETLPLAKRAASLEPNQASHRINTGWLLASAKRFPDAAAEAQKALSLADNEQDRRRSQELLEETARMQRAPSRGSSDPGSACEAGQGEACLVAGLVLRDGTTGTRDPARAAQFFEKACDAGELDGCVALGLALDRGEGVPQDQKRSLQMLARACDGGLPQGCAEQGYLQLGRGTAPGRKQAVALFRRACEGGDAPACSALAALYESGLGVTRSLTQARDLYAQACAAGYQPACAKKATPPK